MEGVFGLIVIIIYVCAIDLTREGIFHSLKEP